MLSIYISSHDDDDDIGDTVRYCPHFYYTHRHGAWSVDDA